MLLQREHLALRRAPPALAQHELAPVLLQLLPLLLGAFAHSGATLLGADPVQARAGDQLRVRLRVIRICIALHG